MSQERPKFKLHEVHLPPVSLRPRPRRCREVLRGQYLDFLVSDRRSAAGNAVGTSSVSKAALAKPGAGRKSPLLAPDIDDHLPALAFRGANDPSILEELAHPVKLLVRMDLAPGDHVMLTAAVRDLDLSYPGLFKIHMAGPYPELWANNPHLTSLSLEDPDLNVLHAHYGETYARANFLPYHFIHACRLDMEQRLGLPITQGANRGDLHLTVAEREAPPPGADLINGAPFWIINAGGKTDFTNKWWEFTRYQKLVELFPDIIWVQIGRNDQHHPRLQGKNIVNLIGHTDLRALMRLMWHAAGVITPVSLPMHLAAAIPAHPRYNRAERPCIVIAGGREAPTWEAYPWHMFLHTCGKLPCCAHGGCGASRVIRIPDGTKDDSKDKTCRRPVATPSQQVIPRCMDMITVEDVARHVHEYLMAYDYHKNPQA